MEVRTMNKMLQWQLKTVVMHSERREKKKEIRHNGNSEKETTLRVGH